jgi:hypothetical protein
MRHPVAASILDSWGKALIEFALVHSSSEASWVPETIHVLLQRTNVLVGMIPALAQVTATHNSKTAFK